MKTLRTVLALIAMAWQFGAVATAAADDDRNLRSISGSAAKRVALVIGNGAYKSAELKPLLNPANDADDVAAALRGFGFEVLAYKNLNRRRMKDAIAEFGRKAGNADAALFYFAGHGIQIKNQNYLMPVDASALSEADAADEGINVNFPLEEMDNSRARVNLVMLDACRNNDFSGKFRSGAARGLALPASVPKGTVIVYATDPGNVASDGAGRNGLFTAGLLAGLKGKDLTLDGVLTTASAIVEQRSGGKQIPYVNGPQLVKKTFHFRLQGVVAVNGEQTAAIPDSSPTVPPEPFVAAVDSRIEDALWAEVQKGNDAEEYEAYLQQFPTGKYVALAKIRLKKRQEEIAVRREQQAWESAERNGDESAFLRFLHEWPAGRNATGAQAKVNELRERGEEQKLWLKASAVTNLDDATHLQNYLAKFPDGSKAKVLKQRLADFQGVKKLIGLWVWRGTDSNGDTLIRSWFFDAVGNFRFQHSRIYRKGIIFSAWTEDADTTSGRYQVSGNRITFRGVSRNSQPSSDFAADWSLENYTLTMSGEQYRREN